MEDIAEFLRLMRGRSGLSLQQLADKSGLSRRALSYWEANAHQPRLPELQIALDALDATDLERRRALLLLDAPRGAQHLRAASGQERYEEELGAQPAGGDLLRALRRRRGLLLEQAAAQAGVSAATLSRWEHGKALPQPEKLERLLHSLGAREGERAVLKQGYRFLMAPLRASVIPSDALAESFAAFLADVYIHPENKLHELRFLCFEAQAWTLAARDDTARHLLACICAHYAAHIAGLERLEEAGRYARRALAIMPAAPASLSVPLQNLPFSVLPAMMIAAQAEVYRSSSPAPERGLRMLRAWHDLALPLDTQAWMLADMGEYLMLQGDYETATRLRRDACQVAERGANPFEMRWRKFDLAKTCMKAGKGEHALSLVTLAPEDSPSRRAQISLLYAEGLLGMRENDEAQAWLLRANNDILAHDLTYMRGRAAALELLLTRSCRGLTS